MKHKKLFISLTAVAAVIVFLGIFILMWYVGDTYKDFEKFRKEIAIEGLDDGAVPQGITAYTASYTTTDADGKTVTDTQQYFLVSAYMNDGSPSRIYVTGYKTGYVGYVTLKNADGTDHFGHVGGIATNGSYLWVTYNDSILVAKASESYAEDKQNILLEIIDKASKNVPRETDADEEETEEDAELEEDESTDESAEVEEGVLSIQFTASFNANCNAAFLYYYDDPRYSSPTYDRLYVGEFYRKGNYETDESHRLKTPAGYSNNAFMYEYNIDASSTDNPYGLTRLVSNLKDDPTMNEENNVPKIQKIFSIPEKIQGIAFSGRSGYGSTDGMLVLSQSYGLANSHLLCFDWSTVNETSNRALYTSISGYSFVYKDVYRTSGGISSAYTDSTLYLYYIDKGNSNMLVSDYSVPSMSEGMCSVTPSGGTGVTITRVYVLFESGSKKYNTFTRENIKNVYSFVPR